jgi:hypothetical protein
MLFDVVELGARLESIVVPVQLPHPAIKHESLRHPAKMCDTSQMDVRVPVTDVAQVAFEVADVHGIKADLERSCEFRARWDAFRIERTVVTNNLISASVRVLPTR